MNTKFKYLNLKQIDLIQDPIYSYIETETFVQIYEPILILMNGEDNEWFGCYFVSSPINKSILEFRNNEKKEIFQEWAEELGLIPKLKEIQEGEDEKDKQKRNKKKHKEKKIYKPNKDKIFQELQKLVEKLSLEYDPKIREKLNAKIIKAQTLIDHSV